MIGLFDDYITIYPYRLTVRVSLVTSTSASEYIVNVLNYVQYVIGRISCFNALK